MDNFESLLGIGPSWASLNLFVPLWTVLNILNVLGPLINPLQLPWIYLNHFSNPLCVDKPHWTPLKYYSPFTNLKSTHKTTKHPQKNTSSDLSSVRFFSSSLFLWFSDIPRNEYHARAMKVWKERKFISIRN